MEMPGFKTILVLGLLVASPFALLGTPKSYSQNVEELRAKRQAELNYRCAQGAEQITIHSIGGTKVHNCKR